MYRSGYGYRINSARGGGGLLGDQIKKGIMMIHEVGENPSNYIATLYLFIMYQAWIQDFSQGWGQFWGKAKIEMYHHRLILYIYYIDIISAHFEPA